jgi:hypothetical protein
VVAILDGYRTWRDVLDTTEGEVMKRTLLPAAPSGRGAVIDVECRTRGKYPIYIDDQEIGRLCPAKGIPVAPGKRTIGVFIPTDRRIVSVERDIPAGEHPLVVRLRD